MQKPRWWGKHFSLNHLNPKWSVKKRNLNFLNLESSWWGKNTELLYALGNWRNFFLLKYYWCFLFNSNGLPGAKNMYRSYSKIKGVINVHKTVNHYIKFGFLMYWNQYWWYTCLASADELVFLLNLKAAYFQNNICCKNIFQYWKDKMNS